MGEGRAYVHLRSPVEQRQVARGTLSLDWWHDGTTTDGAQLELVGGPTLILRLESDKLSTCVQGRILRYEADWPGTMQ
jgi:hypothetical protein